MQRVWSLFVKIRTLYFRFERLISSVSLVGGFVFDALTLRRVDLFWDNVWVAGHFCIIAVCIVAINFLENRKIVRKKSDATFTNQNTWVHFWLVTILQFFFGGLLSTFLVFYFRSGTLSVTWPFLLLLGVAFFANESLKKHYTRLVFQISLFFLSLFSFAIFIVPIIVHQIGPVIFVLSGLVSIVILWLFLVLLRLIARETFQQSKKMLLISVVSIFAITNALYFANIIPPLPLSLQDGGVYHSLVHVNGGYLVTTENQSWLNFLSPYQVFHEVPGQPIYALTAVFSPTALNTTIIHEWQQYDTASHQWVTKSRVHLTIIGGRAGGYNTYSMLGTITPGEWRVNVDTSNGQVIGRLLFRVIGATTTPTLITEVKN